MPYVFAHCKLVDKRVNYKLVNSLHIFSSKFKAYVEALNLVMPRYNIDIHGYGRDTDFTLKERKKENEKEKKKIVWDLMICYIYEGNLEVTFYHSFNSSFICLPFLFCFSSTGYLKILDFHSVLQDRTLVIVVLGNVFLFLLSFSWCSVEQL